MHRNDWSPKLHIALTLVAYLTLPKISRCISCIDSKHRRYNMYWISVPVTRSTIISLLHLMLLRDKCLPNVWTNYKSIWVVCMCPVVCSGLSHKGGMLPWYQFTNRLASTSGSIKGTWHEQQGVRSRVACNPSVSLASPLYHTYNCRHNIGPIPFSFLLNSAVVWNPFLM